VLSPRNGSSRSLALLTCVANPPRILEDGVPVKSTIQVQMHDKIEGPSQSRGPEYISW